ncbi:hypothetical protein NRIC_11200 [Enterococcus florum]|uniref:Core domain-containing protein n=1 Tax=Enterococcus florum TaxID=2480627 RepID=A0A4V0WPB0_9ENTE|nr:iron-sulfur cluster biosynthesis family protein [Enterococcus florum]GCF93229.1 hypothetical protein NRIC_11200 [Enterococcus florum]
MYIQLDDRAKHQIEQHLDSHKIVLLTFEDGVGEYSQHAMIHMQTQFSINIIEEAMPKEGYDEKIKTNTVDFWIKGYSKEDLQEEMTLRWNERLSTYVLAGEGGIIDDNVSFIDFTKKRDA